MRDRRFRSARLAVLAVLVLALGLQASASHAPRRPADRAIVLDRGVMRWADTRAEVALFGVNYYPPFAMDFAALGQVGADRDTTIRRDVAQFVRLRLDVVRLHCFDREISDPAGNLVDDEHLRLLDLLLSECKRNGIYAVLTPIAWWGTGGPTNGFSDRFTMHRMTTDRSSWEPQRRYLDQFLRHRNRYTGLAYGEDPGVVAIELINEPIVPDGTTNDQVTEYIDALTDAVRQAGCRKPVFFNGWGGRLGAVGRSKADGCTFGWYPTGLVAGHVLKADFLPRIADFADMRDPALTGKAIGVYEFDAADVAEPHMYPAMARAFRAGGAQFAAQFQYDATPLAPTNVNWQTHYLNLVYAPKKAISFMIASDAFHDLPRRHAMRSHPANMRFGDYRVSHAEALSERVGQTVHLYANDTKTRPPSPSKLGRIAGCGSSPIAAYDGTGAYFLDRVKPGLWRLEVYPDVVWVADPFGATGLGREVSRVIWRARTLRLSLPDLGADFEARRAGAVAGARAKGGAVSVRPGITYLRRRGVATAWPADDGTSFWAPPEQEGVRAAVWHDPPAQWLAGRPLTVRCTVAPPTGAANADEPSASLQYRTGTTGPWTTTPMRPDGPYRRAANITGSAVRAGTLQYRVVIGQGEHARVFPGGGVIEATKSAVSFSGVTLLRIAPETGLPPVSVPGAPGRTASAAVVPSPRGHALRLEVSGFDEPPSCTAIRLPVAGAAPAAMPENVAVVVRARSVRADTTGVELGLVQDDGQAFGGEVSLSPMWRDIRIAVGRLGPLWSTRPGRPDLSRVREISLIFGAWLYGEARGRPHGFEIEGIRLEPDAPAWSVPVLGASAPIPLLSGDARVALQGTTTATTRMVGGSDGPALRVEAPGFGRAPDSLSFRVDIVDALEPWKGLLADRTGIRVRARAMESATTGFELVVLEQDGTPWGATVPVTTEWTDVTLKWSQFRFFEHWAHPTGRGGAGDRVRPERLAAINVCFGAWLYPDSFAQHHGIDFEGVWLERQ